MRKNGRIFPTLLALALLVPATSPLAAHDFWIEPSSFRPEAGERVAIGLRVGEGLQGEPVPRDGGRIERFTSVAAAGETTVVGVEGTDPAGFATPAAPGLHWIVYDSTRAALQMDGPAFDRYLAEEGLESVRQQRAGRAIGPVREVYSRCAKSLLAVGQASGPGHDRVLGLELELVPERSPYALEPGEPLPVRLLFRGERLPGALVAALPASAPESRVAVRSNAEGRAELRLDRPGLWLIKAVHMVPAPAGSGADWESFWASLTFEARAQ